MLFPASRHLVIVWQSVVRTSLVREMEFRGNFIAGVIRQMSWLGIFTLQIELIFRQTSSLSGWNREEVLVILALSRIVEGIMDVLFTSNIIELNEQVNKGTLDLVLTRPLPAQFSAFFNRIRINNFGNILAGIVLLAYASPQLGTTVTLANSATTIALAITGIAIFYALLVCVSTIAFYAERLHTLWSFNALMTEPLTVPFSVFPRTSRLALTYLIPLAFVVFVPAQALTGRLQLWQIPAAIGIAALFLLLANLAWRAGLRRYSSASS